MKNPHLKILLCFFSLAIQLILHCKVSEASSIIDTASLSSTQGIIFTFSSTTYLAGSSAGDFNHDGYEDIMIAVPTDSSNTGIVYVIFGTSSGIPIVNLNTMSTSEGITIRGPSAGSQFGYSVDALGDVNGDHIDDIIIGAYGSNKAYVIFGQSSSLLVDIDLTLTTISSTGQGIVLSGPVFSGPYEFGYQVSRAGDFNHDGINDFMFSSPSASGQQGAVYVIFGNQSIPSTFDLSAQTLTLPQGFQVLGEPLSKLGTSLSSAGDVNGDNIDDIMIGTNALTATAPGGMVLIVYGTQSPVSTVLANTLSSSNQGIIITGTSSSIIGIKGSISSAGDLNNDFIDDLAIGAPTYGNSIAGSGLTYIIYGQNGGFSGNFALSPSSLSPSSGFQILGVPNGNWYFGVSITSADMNGDNLSDLIVGSPGATGVIGTSAGITYVFFGNSYGFSNIDLSSPGPQVLMIYGDDANSELGLVVKSAKDLNSDGINDLVILGTQKAYIIYGSGCGSVAQCSSPTLTPICYASMGCACAASNEFLQDNQCVTQCNPEYYPDDNFICESCPDLCLTCTDSSTCQTCVLAELVVQDGVCQCPTGSYLNRLSLSCKNCPSFCVTCADSYTCQICASGFILQGGLCQCPPGYSLNGSTCQSNDVNDVDDLGNINTINSITDVTNTINAASLTAASVVVPQDPGSVTAGMLAKMLQYIKYLNIPYSQRLELSFKDLNSTYGPFGVGPEMPKEAILEAPFHEIPERFVKFNIVSNFLVNFWDNMIFIAILSAVLLMIVIVEFGFVKIKQKPAPSFLRLIRLNGQNFFLMQFYNVFGDVLLYIALDLRKVTFSSREAAISFFVSILFTCIGCIILSMHLYILIRFITFRKNPSWTSKIEEFSKNYKDADALITHFKDNTFISQSFLFVFMIRNCLFNLVLGLLSDFPVLQASLIVAMSAIMLLYLVFQRAFKTIVNLLQHITCELILLIVNICVLIMAQLDFTKAASYVVRDQLSDVIIYTSLIFSFVPETFLVIKLAVAVFDSYKKSHKKPPKTQVNTGTKSGLGLKIQKRSQDINGSPSLYGQDDILNDSTVDLNTMQNSSIVNLKTNNSSFITSLNDSTLQTWQHQQKSMETMIPVDNMRGPVQQWKGTSSEGSELRAIQHASKVIEETNITNSFFVNNKARERWSRKKIKKNFN